MRKSMSRKKGKNFVAAGLGRYGPYAVGTHRVGKGLYVKASIGTKGVTTGLKLNRLGHSFEVGYNHTTNAPYARIKKRSK